MAAILALQRPSTHRLLEVVEGPLAGFRRVIVVPDFTDPPALWGQPRDLGGVLGLEISHHVPDCWGRAAKRIFDIALLVLLSPLWLAAPFAIAVLIAVLDRQNPFFIHRRLGMGGREFPMWKFRTMRPGAEENLRTLLSARARLPAADRPPVQNRFPERSRWMYPSRIFAVSS